jgi:hypothetical protein
MTMVFGLGLWTLIACNEMLNTMLEGISFWSAVTCHRFGPWRPAAMLPRRSICLLESFYSPALRLVAADQSADRSDALQRGSRSAS